MADTPAGTEERRLARLRRMDALDLDPVPGQQDLALLAALVTSSPAAATVLVDDTRVVPLAGHGCRPVPSRRAGSVADRVVRSGMPVVLRDVQEADRARDPLLAALGGVQVVAVPLRDDGLVLGALAVAAPWPAPLGGDAVRAMEIVADRVVAELELRRTQVELVLERGARELHRRNDELTGLPSRRALYERAAIEFARHRRHGADLVVALVDVRRHGAGRPSRGTDHVLVQRVAHVLREGKRTVDALGRWSGARFVLVAPDTPADAVGPLTARLEELVGRVAFDGEPARCRVAVVPAGPGVEDFPTAVAAAVERLSPRADAAAWFVRDGTVA